MVDSYLIIDGRNLLWRCSDAFRELSAQIGDEEISTGGIYGFLSLLSKIKENYGGRPIIAWEGVNNFRYKIYPPYKDRGEIDHDKKEFLKELKNQESRVKALLRCLGVRQYSGVDCEADDVIGRLAYATKKKVSIYSADSDLRQLVSERVVVIAPGFRGQSEKVYGVEEVCEKHGVGPEYIADLKALAGDSSDNIPGVRGIGEVTAVKLIKAFGGVEKVVKAAKQKDLGWPVSDRFMKMVDEHSSDLFLFKELTTIRRDSGYKEISMKKNLSNFYRYCKLYKFYSLLTNYGIKQIGE